MGSMKLDLRYTTNSVYHTIEKLHGAAFGPSPSLYRQLSLCGWRPLLDYRLRDTLIRPRISEDRPLTAKTPPGGIAVRETDAEMTIEVALAAIREESLHLAVSGKMVIIRGELRRETSSAHPDGSDAHPDAHFQHIIRLPSTVNPGGFQAQVVNDIVQIHFDKRHCPGSVPI